MIKYTKPLISTEILFIFYDHAASFQVTGEEVPHNPQQSAALQAYVHAQFLLVLVVYNNLFATEHVSNKSIHITEV